MTRRTIVVVLDGLRRDMLSPTATPELHAFAATATSFAAHRSVFPSATRVATSCFATGCRPATHGLQGNSVALLEDGQLTRRDVGHPDFMDHWRRVRGRTFAVPTMAERLARVGRKTMVFNNVSQGPPVPTIRTATAGSSIAPGPTPLAFIPSLARMPSQASPWIRKATPV